MSEQFMTYVVDWQLPQEAFRHQVRDLIQQAEKKGKVLALPIQIQPGKAFLDLMTLLLAQVNCDGCDAPCCKSNPKDVPIQLLPPEHQRLSEKYGDKHFIVNKEGSFLPMPCPFLKQNRCTIYPDRPLVCILYPFQPGARDGSGDMMLALSVSCPESRRIARNIYMMSWRIRHQFWLLGEGNFLKAIF